jgi:hypothetical protein
MNTLKLPLIDSKNTYVNIVANAKLNPRHGSITARETKPKRNRGKWDIENEPMKPLRNTDIARAYSEKANEIEKEMDIFYGRMEYLYSDLMVSPRGTDFIHFMRHNKKIEKAFDDRETNTRRAQTEPIVITVFNSKSKNALPSINKCK